MPRPDIVDFCAAKAFKKVLCAKGRYNQKSFDFIRGCIVFVCDASYPTIVLPEYTLLLPELLLPLL